MPSQQLRTALEVSPLGNAPYAHQYPHVAPGTKRMYKRLKRAPSPALGNTSSSVGLSSVAPLIGTRRSQRRFESRNTGSVV